MCGPAAILGSAQVALQTGAAISQYAAQSKASKANATAAQQALIESWNALGVRQMQESDASAMTSRMATQQARAASGLATVVAGAAGVGGPSVDAVLGDIGNDAAAARVSAAKNLEMVLSQLQAEKRGVRATAIQRRAAQPPPSAFLLGAQIAQSGLGLASDLTARPKP